MKLNFNFFNNSIIVLFIMLMQLGLISCKDTPAEDLGFFIAVGTNGQIWHSPDGATWTDYSLSVSDEFRSIAYGDGRFVIVGVSGVAFYSDNGIDWTESSAGGANLYSVAYGNNRFVAVGIGGLVRISMDGTWWSSDLGPGGQNLTGIAFGNGQFVAVGYNNQTWYSTDGVTWIDSTLAPPLNNFWNISFANERFTTLSNTTVFMSFDGSWWSDDVGPGGYDICYGNNRFVIIGSSIYYSDNGTTWIDSSPGGGLLLNSITYGNDRFVTVGTGQAWYSNDGINWTDSTPDITVAFRDIIYIPYDS